MGESQYKASPVLLKRKLVLPQSILELINNYRSWSNIFFTEDTLLFFIYIYIYRYALA